MDASPAPVNSNVQKNLLAAAQIAREAEQKIGVDQVLKAISAERKDIGFTVIEKFNLRFFITVAFAFLFSTQACLAADVFPAIDHKNLGSSTQPRTAAAVELYIELLEPLLLSLVLVNFCELL